MSLETTAKYLQSFNIDNPHQVLAEVMADPIIINGHLPKSEYMQIIEEYQIVAQPGAKFIVQGVKMHDYQSALDFLIYRRNIDDAIALRTLALAIDLAKISR